VNEGSTEMRRHVDFRPTAEVLGARSVPGDVLGAGPIPLYEVPPAGLFTEPVVSPVSAPPEAAPPSDYQNYTPPYAPAPVIPDEIVPDGIAVDPGVC
jgi:hypothetical protein